MTDMHRLDIDRFPLSGVRLIEASAGTGKTFTIAALYLRLLLDAEAELGRDLDLREVLVVTFTEAATEELRDRIRRRLRDAETAFSAGVASDDDAVLQTLLARRSDHATCAERLRDMLTRLDEAPIYTIHGFCNRTLRDNAFESGALFEAEFIKDEGPLREALMEDFWRSRFYRAEPSYVAWLRGEWPTPGDLLGSVKGFLNRHRLTMIPAPDPAAIQALEASLAQRLAELPALWREGQAAARRLLDEAAAAKTISAAKDAYKAENLDGLWPVWDTWFGDPVLPPPASLVLLTDSGLRTRLSKAAEKKGIEPPQHPLFTACNAVCQDWEALKDQRRIQVMHDALGYLREGLAARKRDEQVLSFDDLLTHLSAALQGPRGEALSRTLAARYPVALIDEFQDTDPEQYTIFDRIYRDRPRTGLFMIGDPKQAIYSFRGADVFTYMAARRSTDAGSRFTLGTNWRSTDSLVRGVDALFRRNPRRFIYDQGIGLPEVSAAGRADKAPLVVDGETPSGLQVWFHPRRDPDKPINKNVAQPRLAEACGDEIARLLSLAENGRATLGGEPVRPRDIAVLVRNHHEAAEVKRALQARGIASVHHSRDSVFASEEAAELERLLQAVAEPENEHLLRAAACTRLMGLTAEQLYAEVNAGRPWEDRMEAFAAYRDRWESRGFLPMLHTLLHEQGVIRRVFEAPEAERRMTNLLHLGELLQEAAAEVYGMTGLLRWLQEQRDDPGNLGEAGELRLESDEALVKIVTIHKSKGLQYPVVFLPYVGMGREPGEIDRGYPLFHGSGDELMLDLGSAELEAHRDAAYRESMAEALRLLYVALTRASHCCYVGFGAFKDAEHAGLGYLLCPPQDPDRGRPVSPLQTHGDDALRNAWQALADAEPGTVALTQVPAGPPVPGPSRDEAGGSRGRAAALAGHVQQRWRLSSYSGLLASHAGQLIERPDYDALDEPSEDEAAGAGGGWNIFTFPRGARAGTCLHKILELADFRDPDGLAGVVAHRLPAFGFDERWAPVVTEHLRGVLGTPLAPGGVTLADIDGRHRLNELGFFFPADGVRAADVDAALPALPGAPRRPALDFATLNGMLKGYIDLVFEHDGRFYLADYKSNHLGHRPAHYHPERLARAMAASRYDLQYMLYALALHRYLRSRLPDYDYERHFGGVYYLFLRGMSPASGPERGIYYARPEQAVIERFDALFAGGGREAA